LTAAPLGSLAHASGNRCVSGEMIMKILDVLQPEAILPELKSQTKQEVLEELSAPVAQLAQIDPAALVRVLLERERLGSTGIGGGIGIPHGKLPNLDQLMIGFGLSRKGVDFESLDGAPTRLFFLLVTPENSTGLHLKLLARISRILKNEPIKERLLQATSREQIYGVIKEEDEEF
jgi:PTS system nitrogen regulatory IIA component